MPRTLITSSTTASIGTAPEFRTIHRASNGRLIALSEASGVVHYWTSPDGATWTDRGALPSATFTLAQGYHAQIVTESSVEKLVIWYVPTGTAGLHPGNPDCYAYTAIWDGTSLFTSGSTVSYSPFAYGSTYTSLAAFYDTGIWHIALNVGVSGLQVGFFAISGGSILYNEFAVTGSVTTVSISNSSGPLTLNLKKSGSTLVFSAQDAYRNQISVLSYTWNGTAYAINPSALETVAAGANYHALALDNTGNVDILYANGGTQLTHKKRTGSNAYSASTYLDALNPTQDQFSIVHDTATDDLWAVYSRATAQPNGELYAIRRSGPTWQTPGMVDGGDAAGYRWPKLASTVQTTGVDLAYLVGTGTTRSLYYNGVSGGSPPGAPINLTHGDVAGLTPVLHADYVNVSPSDAMQYRQVQVYDAAGTTLIWDTGQVATTSQDTTYAGPALSYNTNYTWRARDWDSISNTGAGTAGPWSALATVDPRRSGAVAITSITSGGATSSTTIAGRLLQVNATYTHPDGHAASQWQFTLYEHGTSIVHDQTAWTAFTPAQASGTSFTTPVITTSVNNATSYDAVLRVIDAVTGLVYASATATYSVAFTPPPAPTAFTVTTFDELGQVVEAWTNPSVAVSDLLQYKPSDETIWTTISSGTLLTTKTLYAVPSLVPYDYRVAVIDAQGLQSDWATFLNVTLGLKADKYGIRLINAAVPTQVVFLAFPKSWDVLTWTAVYDEQVVEPVGSRWAKTTFGLTDYEVADSMAFTLRGQDDIDLSYTGKSVRDTLRSFQGQRGVTCIYTDPKGTVVPVKLTQLKWGSDDDVDWFASFYLRQTEPLTPPVY